MLDGALGAMCSSKCDFRRTSRCSRRRSGIIASYGNLRFGNHNEHVLLNPIAAIEEDNTLLARCERVVGRPLYPIGYQEHQDREAVFVDEDGWVYMNFGQTLYRIADSFESALAYLAQAGFARSAEGKLIGKELPGWNIENAGSR